MAKENKRPKNSISRRSRSRQILLRSPLYFLVSVLLSVVFLFQFSPFLSMVNLQEENGEYQATLRVNPGQEIVFYGDTETCVVTGLGSGGVAEPWPIEVSRYIDGSWFYPWQTVYRKPSSAGHPAYARVVCSDSNARVWVTQATGSFEYFTQNTTIRIRLLFAGGAFLFALIVLPYAFQSVRYLITGKVPTRFKDRII